MKFGKRFLTILVILCSLILSVIYTGNVSYAANKSPKLNFRTLYIVKNSKYNLRVYNTLDSYSVTFESDDTNIVTIRKVKNTSCKIVPKASGNTIVTAYVYDENDEIVTTLKCNVTVSPRAASIKFNKKRYKMTVGTVKKIKAVIKPNISNEYPLYSSDNTTIATVSSNGTVSALSAGQTTIRAYISNGRESSYTLTVSEPDDAGTQYSNPDNTQSPQSTGTADSSRIKSKNSKNNRNDK